MALRIGTLSGAEIGPALAALAELRIKVFREWPYLYQGSADYERQYLQTYVDCPRSLAIVVRDGDVCVGASTALPLVDAEAAVQRPFREHGHLLEQIDYFGESVLLPAYRGRGLGVKFFELREAHARDLGLAFCAFCAVERPAGHPARPPDYVPNDAFWMRRGYRKRTELRTQFDWPDLGQTKSTAKPLVFWTRTL